MLTRERMLPIISRGRKIIIYPDHDGIEKWKQQAEMINYDMLNVNSKIVEKNWRPDDGDKADIADILVRLMYETRSCKVQKVEEVIQQWRESNPFFGELCDRLHLEPLISA